MGHSTSVLKAGLKWPFDEIFLILLLFENPEFIIQPKLSETT